MSEPTNMIPSINASGSFEAHNPFDLIVDPAIFYTVEAIRTVSEMQAMKMNLYELVFKPVGVPEDEYKALLDTAVAQGGVVVSLTSRNNPTVYVLSTYFKSFPLVDGVKYERMAFIVDMGPCPPSLKEALTQAQEDIRYYVENCVGINAVVRIGTIPTPGYVSKDQADVFETTRQNNITDTTNYITKNKQLEITVASQQAYIDELEAQIINQ